MKFVTAGIAEYQTIMERLTDMDIGIDKYFSFVVLKSPIVKAHMPMPRHCFRCSHERLTVSVKC